MSEPNETTAGDSATETHHEPHGGAMPHGAADDIAEHGQVDEHEAAVLGPVDTRAWAAAFLGIAQDGKMTHWQVFSDTTMVFDLIKANDE